MQFSQLVTYLQQIELKWKVLLLLYLKINADRWLWLIISSLENKTKPKNPTTLPSTALPTYMTDGRMSTYAGKGGSSAGMNCYINGKWNFAI